MMHTNFHQIWPYSLEEDYRLKNEKLTHSAQQQTKWEDDNRSP